MVYDRVSISALLRGRCASVACRLAVETGTVHVEAVRSRCARLREIARPTQRRSTEDNGPSVIGNEVYGIELPVEAGIGEHPPHRAMTTTTSQRPEARGQTGVRVSRVETRTFSPPAFQPSLFWPDAQIGQCARLRNPPSGRRKETQTPRGSAAALARMRAISAPVANPADVLATSATCGFGYTPARVLAAPRTRCARPRPTQNAGRRAHRNMLCSSAH